MGGIRCQGHRGASQAGSADLSSIRNDVDNQDQASLSSHTHALAALHSDRPPTCAEPLYHYAKMIRVTFGIAGQKKVEAACGGC